MQQSEQVVTKLAEHFVVEIHLDGSHDTVP
jgi:hypothetical protein